MRKASSYHSTYNQVEEDECKAQKHSLVNISNRPTQLKKQKLNVVRSSQVGGCIITYCDTSDGMDMELQLAGPVACCAGLRGRNQDRHCLMAIPQRFER